MASASHCRRLPGVLIAAADAMQFWRTSRLIPVDGTWYMEKQGMPKTPAELFEELRLPGACHFDIDALGDTSRGLPHMLPTQATMQNFASRASIQSLEDAILVYVHSNSLNAARVWWTFRVFGFTNVAILQGGIKEWANAGGVLDSNPRAERSPAAPLPMEIQQDLTVSLEDMQQLVCTQTCPMVDTRSPKSHVAGHIPGTVNMPYASLMEEDWAYFKDPLSLQRVLEERSLDISHKVLASCGSGVSACIFVFACHLLGAPLNRMPVYDGSFAEWSRPDMDRTMCPIETGLAAPTAGGRTGDINDDSGLVVPQDAACTSGGDNVESEDARRR